MTTKKIISIIGGGAVGVSLLYQLIKKNIDIYHIPNLEINIFEKSSFIGRGLAYGKDSGLVKNICGQVPVLVTYQAYDIARFSVSQSF